MNLVATMVPSQLPVYRYDAVTGKQILPAYDSLVLAMKGERIGQLKLRKALDTQTQRCVLLSYSAVNSL